MLWFFALIGFLVLVPGLLLLAALGVVVMTIPFIALFAVCFGFVALFSFVLWPGGMLFDALLAFALGIIVARYFLPRVPRRA